MDFKKFGRSGPGHHATGGKRTGRSDGQKRQFRGPAGKYGKLYVFPEIVRVRPIYGPFTGKIRDIRLAYA